MLAQLLVERVVGLALHFRHELREHHHDVVDDVAVTLPEEAGEDGLAHGFFQLVQPMGGRFADLVEERPLIVAVQPREVKVEDARLLDQPELPDGDPHRFHRGVAGIGLDRVEW